MKTASTHPIEIADQLENKWTHFTLYRPNIVLIEYKDGDDELDVEMANTHIADYRKLVSGKPCHVIADFRKTDHTFTNEARSIFASDVEHNKLRLSQTIIVEKLAQRIVANFFIRFNKPLCPTRVVDSFESALSWIEKQ